MTKINPNIRAQVQEFIKAMDFVNTVPESINPALSKMRDEAFLPRWLTTLVAEEVREQGVTAPNVLNFGSPVFSNETIEKGADTFYAFDKAHEYRNVRDSQTSAVGAVGTPVNSLTKTLDNYVTLRNLVVANGVPLDDLDKHMNEWHTEVSALMLRGSDNKILKEMNKEGYRNQYVIPNRFADLENSFAKKVMDLYSVQQEQEIKKNRPRLKM